MNKEQAERWMAEIKPQDESDKTTQIIDRYTDAEAFRKNYEDTWDLCYETYMSYRPDSDIPDSCSNLFVPSAWSVIETLLPQIMSAIVNNKVFVQVLPVEKDDVKQAKLVEQLIMYQLNRAEFYPKFYQWFKSCLIYGTAYMKVGWDFRSREITATESETLFGLKIGTKQIRKKIIEFDGPQMDYVNPYDLYVDPRATRIKNARYAIHRVWKDIDYLYEMQERKLYKNIDLVRPGVGYLDDILRSVFGDVSRVPTGQIAQDKNKVELLEYWERGCVRTLANRTTLIRDDKNEYHHGEIPIIDIRDTVLPDMFFGVGSIEPILSLIHELNALRNQRLENVKNITNKVYLGNRNADVNWETLEDDDVPGGVILTDDINNTLKPKDENAVFVPTINEENIVKNDIQEATGVWDYAKGATPSRAETATGISKLQQAAFNRFALKIQNIMQTGVKPLVRFFIQLDQQFLTKAQAVRIAGEKGWDFKDVSAADIPLEYDLVENIGAIEYNKDLRRQQLLMVSQTPIMNLPNIRKDELQKEILDELVDDPDRIVGPIQAAPPMVPGQEMQEEGGPQEPGSPKKAKQIPSIGGVGAAPLPTQGGKA